MALADQHNGASGLSGARIAQVLFGLAVVLTILRPWLPDGLVRPPEWWLLPWRDWIDAIFNYVTFELGFIEVTRFLSGGLEFVLDAVANILYGRARWPRLEAVPWTAVAAIAAVRLCRANFLQEVDNGPLDLVGFTSQARGGGLNLVRTLTSFCRCCVQ